MSDERELLRRTAEIAADFLETLDERPVFPPTPVEALGEEFGGPLAEGPTEPLRVIEELARRAEPGVTAIPGGRYFGFVTGGGLPAALAADWLTSTWDQNAFAAVSSPAASVIEEVAGDWLKELLGIPAHASFAFVTGCQMAHVTCLAAARHTVLEHAGWNVARDGLWEAPRIHIVAGAMRHVTVDRALRLLGLGTGSVVEVAADDQGRMRTDALADTLGTLTGPVIVCGQAGEVNSGSIDPLLELAELAHSGGAWLHLDAAFGIWAAASPRLRYLVAGHEQADSWAFDAHKWLNVPYDCGVAVCAHPEAHRSAMTMQAAYLSGMETGRDGADWGPDASRRSRGITVYAALRSLGRQGVAGLVERCCERAGQFAAAISELPGCEVLNEVVLNQVLFRFGDDATTNAVLARVQESGEAWMSGTSWDGRAAIRLSVSSWRTTADDIARTVAAFERAAAVAR
ncbi:MAG TPA: pyridoxal-dependent decarboxylase [Gaiellaceae bacterium]